MTRQEPKSPVAAILRPLTRHGRVLGHVLFWLVALGFYTVYFGQRQSTYGQSLIFVALLFPITIATTYFLIYWLIPRYLLARRYLAFAVYFVYTLVFSVYLELMLVTVMFVTVADFREIFIAPTVSDFLNAVVGMYFVVFGGVALHLLRRWYAVRESNVELDRMRLEAELKLKEAELKLLKSQIHPHFLFNTLNNLYGLTLERSDLAPDVVLKMSSMLDYMLYRGREKEVPLEEEVEYVRSYLALEELRFSNRIHIRFDVAGPVERFHIAPLLLIPFVENSFKHGVGRSRTNGDIQIDLGVEDQRIRFVAENSKGGARPADSTSESEGIGLQNVRRRLELLYPDRHTLEIVDGPERFRIELELVLTESSEDTLPHR